MKSLSITHISLANKLHRRESTKARLFWSSVKKVYQNRRNCDGELME